MTHIVSQWMKRNAIPRNGMHAYACVCAYLLISSTRLLRVGLQAEQRT